MRRQEANAAGKVYEILISRLENMANIVEQIVRAVCDEREIEYDAVTSRVKSTSSVVEKLQRDGGPESLTEIRDKVGVRVVVRHASDVDQICSAINDKLEVTRDTRHGLPEDDRFGYASRHLLVKVPKFEDYEAEIQVRSILQHAWATISHSLIYKSSLDIPATARRRLARVAALLEIGDELFELFRDDVRVVRQNYAGEISEGNLKALPIDLYSIRGSLSMLPTDEIAERALGNGWRRSGASLDSDVYISRLVRTAKAAELASVEEIQRVADDLVTDDSWLSEMASAVQRARGSKPAALVTDILTLRLVSLYSTEEISAVAKDAGLAASLVDIAATTPVRV